MQPVNGQPVSRREAVDVFLGKGLVYLGGMGCSDRYGVEGGRG